MPEVSMSPEEDAAFVAGWMAHMNKQPPAVPDVIGLHTEKLKKLWFAGYNGRQEWLNERN